MLPEGRRGRKLSSSSKKLSGFIRGSFILVLSNVCLKAINFFLLPLYTANLTPAMLGISDSITSFTGFLFPLLTFGLDSAYSAFYFQKEERDRPKRVFGTLLLAFCVLGVLPFFLVPAADPISQLLFGTAEYAPIVMIACASLSLNLWYLPFSLELRLRNSMGLFGASSVLGSLLMILLNILFVATMKLGPISLVLSTVIVNAFQLIFLSIAVHQLPCREFIDFKLLKSMIIFALPLIPMAVMNWVLSLSDRYVLLAFLGDTSVGLYGISARMTNVINIVVSAVQMSYTTFAFGSKDDEGSKKYYRYIFTFEAVALMLFCFVGSLFGREIIEIMASSSYEQAYEPLRDLLFAQMFYAMTTIVSYGALFCKKSNYLLVSVTVGAVTNLVLNIILIPILGLTGAGFSTLVGYGLNFALTYMLSERVYPCDYNIGRVLGCIVLLYGLSLVFADAAILARNIVALVCFVVVFLIFRKEFRAFSRYLGSRLKGRR